MSAKDVMIAVSVRPCMEGRADPVCTALQELWCGTKRMDGTFLHSPLLDELKSLEIMLLRQAYRQDRRGQAGRDEGSVGSSTAVQSALKSAPSVSVNLPGQVSIVLTATLRLLELTVET